MDNADKKQPEGEQSWEIPPHVVRMRQELSELLPRLRNLDGFLDTKTFKELSTLEQKLMHDQRDNMEEYAKTLALRYHLGLIR